MKQLFGYLKPYRKTLYISVILIAFSAAASLAIPTLMQNVINDGIQAKGGPDKDVIMNIGYTMLVIAIVGLITGVANSFITAMLSQSVGADMRDEGFKKIQSFTYQDIEKFQSSNLVVRLTNDINQVQKSVMLALTTLLRAPIMLIGAFILAMITLPDLWYMIIILFVCVLLVIFVVSKKMVPLFGVYQKLIDKINNIIKENFVGARVVKSFVQEKHEEAEFDVSNSKLAKVNLRIGNIFSVVLPVLMLSVNVIIAIAIYLIGDIALSNPDAIGASIAYMNYLSMIMMALIIAGMTLIQVSRAMVSLKRFNEIINTKPAFTYPEANHIKELNGDIKFDNVTFTYPGHEHPSLRNISFEIKPGEKVGVIGATGSGKSTLVQVMLRLFDVDEGAILIDDHNIKDIPKDVIRKDVAIVLQKPILFSGTIKENITAGHDAHDHIINEAISMAQAAEFIDKLDKQENSVVQQRGSNFSGGQKQRLSIARGFVRQAPILILDDSTSALDSISEKKIKDVIYSQSHNQTIILIAQKISSIIEADKIIVLDEGRLAGFDTPSNLLANNPTYQEIYESQKGRDENAN